MSTAVGIARDDPALHPQERELAEELERLARLVSGREDLTLFLVPGHNWCWIPTKDCLIAPPEDLHGRDPDACRGLIMHETAHVVLTRAHELLSDQDMRRLGVLLNAVEDFRIENWLEAQWPGTIPWLTTVKDRIAAERSADPEPASRQSSFLIGLFMRWWTGADQDRDPQVTAALEAAWPHVERAISAYPSSNCPASDEPAAIIRTQQEMLDVFMTHIVPIWERLVELDRIAGIARLVMDGAFQSGRRLESDHPGPNPSRSAPDAGEDAGGDGCGGDGPDSAIQAVAESEYLAVWRQHHASIDALADAFLHRFANERSRWRRRLPRGTRLDLRQAMRAEADPREIERCWSARVGITPRFPAISLVIDRSGSMEAAQRIDKAFQGLVIVLETCLRLGLPTAIWTFNHETTCDKDFDDPVDADMHRRLAGIRESCDGGTNLALAITYAGNHLAQRGELERFMILLTDGVVGQNSARRAMEDIHGKGITQLGLGIGSSTQRLQELPFDALKTDIRPSIIPAAMARMLDRILG